jgi:putative endonuclease
MTMLDRRRLVGQEGEAAAEQYLRRKGYRILSRNVRSSLGELDLVVEDGSVLVFVEVKARRTDEFGGAVHAVHRQKQKKLIQLASQYLSRHHFSHRPCRFDVVLLQETGDMHSQIEHVQNAFEVPGDDLRW